MDTLIELATPGDVCGMQEVFYRAWLVTYPNIEHRITREDIEYRFVGRLSCERLARLRARVANPPEYETTLVARYAGTVVGVCRVLYPPDKNELCALYVLPEYHRLSIGTALCRAAEPYFNPALYTLVEVAAYNERAIAFYAKLGFNATGKHMRDLQFAMKNGAVIPQIEMRREARSA